MFRDVRVIAAVDLRVLGLLGLREVSAANGAKGLNGENANGVLIWKQNKTSLTGCPVQRRDPREIGGSSFKTVAEEMTNQTNRRRVEEKGPPSARPWVLL